MLGNLTLTQYWFVFCGIVVLALVIDLLLDPTGGPE